MDSTELVRSLLENDVLEEVPERDELLVTSTFRNRVEERKNGLENVRSSDEELRARLREWSDDPEIVDALSEIGSDDPEFLSYYCVLAELSEGLSHREIVRTVIVLMQFDEPELETEGNPEPFLPVRGDKLPTIAQLTRRGIVYVWRHDCEPCDRMKEKFETIFEEPPSDISLFGVYGPDYSETLYEAFDVVGAPTTLFIRDGRVDMRLHSSQPYPTLESEIEKFSEL